MNDNSRELKCAIEGCDRLPSVIEAGDSYCSMHAWQMVKRYA